MTGRTDIVLKPGYRAVKRGNTVVIKGPTGKVVYRIRAQRRVVVHKPPHRTVYDVLTKENPPRRRRRLESVGEFAVGVDL